MNSNTGCCPQPRCTAAEMLVMGGGGGLLGLYGLLILLRREDFLSDRKSHVVPFINCQMDFIHHVCLVMFLRLMGTRSK